MWETINFRGKKAKFSVRTLKNSLRSRVINESLRKLRGLVTVVTVVLTILPVMNRSQFIDHPASEKLPRHQHLNQSSATYQRSEAAVEILRENATADRRHCCMGVKLCGKLASSQSEKHQKHQTSTNELLSCVGNQVGEGLAC
jgi:Tfp pilus assembly protein FimT